MRIVARLSVVASLVLAAIACAAPASALADGETVLCAVNEAECPAEDIIGYGFSAPSSTATLRFSALAAIKCISPMARDATERMALYFGSCSEGCSVESRNLFYYANLFEPSGGDAILTIEGGGKGEPQVRVDCEGAECTYGSAVSELHFEGGEPAKVHAHEGLAKKAGGFFCPGGLKWEADYELALPAAYASRHTVEGPVFCSASESACPQRYTVSSFPLLLRGGTELSVGEFPPGGDIHCAESGASLENLDPFTPGGSWELGLADPDACFSSAYTGCELSWEGDPYGVVLGLGSKGDGTLTVLEGEAGIPELGVHCSYLGIPFACAYAGTEPVLAFAGGESGLLQVNVPLGIVSGAPTVCAETVTVEADYEVNSPTTGTLYMTES